MNNQKGNFNTGPYEQFDLEYGIMIYIFNTSFTLIINSWNGLALFFFQKEAGEQFREEHKQNVASMLGEDLARYAIKGSDKDWQDAIKSNTKSVFSVKRYLNLCVHLLLTF